MAKRFIVLNSKNHEALGYLHQFTLSYTLNGVEKKQIIEFRGTQYSENDATDVMGNPVKQKNGYLWQNDI